MIILSVINCAFFKNLLYPGCAFGFSGPITIFYFRIKVESLGTVFPVSYPVSTLIEVAAVIWVSV